MKDLQITRIEQGFEWLQKTFENEDVYTTASIDNLIADLKSLNSCLSWAGEQMAVAKYYLNQAKVKAYNRLKTSSEANQQYYAPSLAKEYVNSQCAKENYDYDICERFTRSLVHIADNLVTALSALKQQLILESQSRYYGND